MCIRFGGKPKTQGILPDPEKVADPTEVGTARKQEDNSLFGGIPDLRVDRSSTSGGVGAGGSGLGTM